ncbi:MerR family transcriptional regulator [Thomasclavelia cocleata]|uniref:MerR family transcriptional regulator n=1 Tax=Thomasclavelia cocleata TaxID=69824 RepID=UPI00248AA4EF|nr:MerR family transcriptional regulator [Thomasclavelia cocleata]
MNTYKTTEIAKIIGIHPNTVRLYEEWKLIPKVARKENGYRIFTDFHIDQFRLARAALQVEILQNGLRKKAVNIIKTSAQKDFEKAICMTEEYLSQIQQERLNAEEAIDIVKNLLSKNEKINSVSLKRKEVSQYLNISMDTLRNWELNGLLDIKRKQNGYRVYTDEDIVRLKIIRSLRCANYSLSAILRMLNALSENPDVDIKNVIDVPKEDDDIITACDKLITSLNSAEENAKYILTLLKEMNKKYNPPF